MALGKNILTIRESKGLSIEDLARKCNVPCSKVIDWEAGDVEPSISALRLISYILGVTIDELVKEKEIVPLDERHYLSDEDYHELAYTISFVDNNEVYKEMQGMNRALKLRHLFNLAKYAFMNEDGVVYDRFLVANTDKKIREKIIRKHFMMYKVEELFEDYIEGRCEFNDNFEKVLDYFDKTFKEESKLHDYRTGCKEGSNIFGLNFICRLTNLEDYSEKKINEIYDEIQEYIRERTGETLLDRLCIFCANEALETFESRDIRKINELADAWKIIRSTLFMLITDDERVE